MRFPRRGEIHFSFFEREGNAVQEHYAAEEEHRIADLRGQGL